MLCYYLRKSIRRLYNERFWIQTNWIYGWIEEKIHYTYLLYLPLSTHLSLFLFSLFRVSLRHRIPFFYTSVQIRYGTYNSISCVINYVSHLYYSWWYFSFFILRCDFADHTRIIKQGGFFCIITPLKPYLTHGPTVGFSLQKKRQMLFFAVLFF